MGIYDREYYREEESFSWRPTTAWSAVNVLIGICVVVYVADLLFMKVEQPYRIANLLAARTSDFANPLRWFSFLTYAFMHAPMDGSERVGLLHILMNMFLLWTFGRDVESRLGRTGFLTLYLTSAFLCGFLYTGLWAVIGRPTAVLGASGAVSTVMVYFICLNPRMTLWLFGVLEVPAWALGAGLLLWDFLGSLASAFGADRSVAYEAHLIGAALGGAAYYYRWPSGAVLDRIQFWWKTRHLRVVRAQAEREEKLATDADKILEKVSQSGYDSLTPREKKVLEDYSRNLREKK
ncbi:MAG: rhomboid family intramembrane serine protease [Planctomycetaceae bacterium]|nr:rhomboid family intramembrane serine protease [Planctomycetaceae bacterium]